MEEPPGWVVEEWNFFQLAKWMGVAPWELAERPIFWQEHAMFVMQVESGLAKMERK